MIREEEHQIGINGWFMGIKPIIQYIQTGYDGNMFSTCIHIKGILKNNLTNHLSLNQYRFVYLFMGVINGNYIAIH